MCRGADSTCPLGTFCRSGNCPSSDDVPPVVLPRTATAHPGGASRQFRRTLGDYNTREPTGTIIIDTSNTYLYLVLDKAKRFATASASAAKASLGLALRGFREWLSGPPPSPTVPGTSWRRADSAELAGCARPNLVSVLCLTARRRFAPLLSLLAKFRFPVTFECATADWFESYEPSSSLCRRDGLDMSGCLTRSSNPLETTTQSRVCGDFLAAGK